MLSYANQIWTTSGPKDGKYNKTGSNLRSLSLAELTWSCDITHSWATGASFLLILSRQKVVWSPDVIPLHPTSKDGKQNARHWRMEHRGRPTLTARYPGELNTHVSYRACSEAQAHTCKVKFFSLLPVRNAGILQVQSVKPHYSAHRTCLCIGFTALFIGGRGGVRKRGEWGNTNDFKK